MYSSIRGCNSAVDATAAELEDVKLWLETQRRLVAVLQNAATNCFVDDDDQAPDTQQRRKYFHSSKAHACVKSIRLFANRNMTVGVLKRKVKFYRPGALSVAQRPITEGWWDIVIVDMMSFDEDARDVICANCESLGTG